MKILLLRLRGRYTTYIMWGCSIECALQCDDANAHEHKSREIMYVSCEVRFQKRTEGFPICVCMYVCVESARGRRTRSAKYTRAHHTQNIENLRWVFVYICTTMYMGAADDRGAF